MDFEQIFGVFSFPPTADMDKPKIEDKSPSDPAAQEVEADPGVESDAGVDKPKQR